MDYSIDKTGVVIMETALPEFCAECDAAEWRFTENALSCVHLQTCERLFAALESRHAKTDAPKVEAKPEKNDAGVTQVNLFPPELLSSGRAVEEIRAGVDKQAIRDRLAVDEAQAEKSAEEPGIDFEKPVEWWKLPGHMTCAEIGAMVGVSKATAGDAVRKGLIPRELVAWAALPTNGEKRRHYCGWMIDEAALKVWDPPKGHPASRAAKKKFDEAITWRWIRGFTPLQIARELGLSRAFVRARVREIFGV